MTMSRRAFCAALAAMSGSAWLGSGPARAQNQGVVVFAAASLKNALDAVNDAWRRDSGKSVRISYAASSALARQIEQGAPAHVFVSADTDWMDYLDGKGLIDRATRGDLLGNRLVLIAPAASARPLEPAPSFDLAGALGDGRLAMANVDAVPAGKYGKAALEKLGVWAKVAPRVAQTENVRAALLLVSRGEAPLGIVYRTDALADPNVRIVGTFASETHLPIIYPIALVRGATHPDAAAFLAFVRSPTARAIFEAQGFLIGG